MAVPVPVLGQASRMPDYPGSWAWPKRIRCWCWTICDHGKFPTRRKPAQSQSRSLLLLLLIMNRYITESAWLSRWQRWKTCSEHVFPKSRDPLIIGKLGWSPYTTPLKLLVHVASGRWAGGRWHGGWRGRILSSERDTKKICLYFENVSCILITNEPMELILLKGNGWIDMMDRESLDIQIPLPASWKKINPNSSPLALLHSTQSLTRSRSSRCAPFVISSHYIDPNLGLS